jgi:2-polyprenyl-6-methoxyphenol hydroxylase-like FAD-dependent oxidoreductase
MAGEGTGLAIAEAYVLAGELHACADDCATAFARYERRLMPFVKEEAGIGGEIRLIVRPKDFRRYYLPECSNKADGSAVHRRVLRRPRSSR